MLPKIPGMKKCEQLLLDAVIFKAILDARSNFIPDKETQHEIMYKKIRVFQVLNGFSLYKQGVMSIF